MSQKKILNASEMGKKGGRAKVPKGTAVLTPAQRRKRAKEAAAARWGNSK